MMKRIFPGLILLSLAGLLVWADGASEAPWALIPAVITVGIAVSVFITIAIKENRKQTA